MYPPEGSYSTGTLSLRAQGARICVSDASFPGTLSVSIDPYWHEGVHRRQSGTYLITCADMVGSRGVRGYDGLSGE